MKGLVKFFTLIAVLIVLVVAGAAAFVRFYLTDEKIKGLLIPQAEKALGRTVSIGAIDVGLFSGISISDFAVKEKDNQTNFLQTERFVLSYNLVPLFKKKLVISEILLDKPFIQVIRNEDGKFNFNSLAFFVMAAQQAKEPAPTSAPTSKAALPLALTVESIRMNKASLTFVDHKKELPNVETTLNLKVALDIGMETSALKFQGKMDSTASAKYDQIALLAQVDTTFSQDELQYRVDLDVDDEKVSLHGTVSQFLTPHIVFNLSSRKLNLDRLLALSATLPKGDSDTDKTVQKKAPPAAKTKSEPVAIAKSLPKGLHAEGKIAIDQAIYKKLPINNFLIEHDLTDGIFTVKDLSANTAGGSLNSKMTIDLNKADPTYSGNVSLNSVELSSLGAGLQFGFANMVSGALQTNLTFEGAGITPETIKKSLSADASYSVNNGRFKNTKVTSSIAALTGLPELKDVTFKDMEGTVKLLKGGIMQIISSIRSKEFSAETKGSINLDGQIDMPILLTLSDTLSKKLDAKGSVTKFLANDKGETELRLKVAGILTEPKTTLDSAGVKDQVKDALTTKAINELGRLMNKKGNSSQSEGDQKPESNSNSKPAEALLKGLFGR